MDPLHNDIASHIFSINFMDEGIERQGTVTAFPSEIPGRFNFIVEVSTREFIVWRTGNGWKDLNGVNPLLISRIGKAIDQHHSPAKQIEWLETFSTVSKFTVE